MTETIQIVGEARAAISVSGLSEAFAPTNMLRWTRRGLEQLWRGDRTGAQDWRLVPMMLDAPPPAAEPSRDMAGDALKAVLEREAATTKRYDDRIAALQTQVEDLTRRLNPPFAHHAGCTGACLDVTCLGCVIADHEALQTQLDTALGLLRRYRAEVPLGHQPHMMADQVDAFLERAGK